MSAGWVMQNHYKYLLHCEMKKKNINHFQMNKCISPKTDGFKMDANSPHTYRILSSLSISQLFFSHLLPLWELLQFCVLSPYFLQAITLYVSHIANFVFIYYYFQSIECIWQIYALGYSCTQANLFMATNSVASTLFSLCSWVTLLWKWERIWIPCLFP